ncbi:hypothetical protein ACQPXH_13365 [Nocardia sp. CA-135953]|uniref:hypothetical protein n=1 Tax=Nocardia sp. CA-135953 TaxID=3239978 RepID=UPI003D98B492
MTAPTAQLLKLARTLGVPVEQLAYLGDVSDADLRAFRRQVTDLFVAGQEAGLRRVAQASKVIPTAITAKMVARSRGALLAARMSGVLDPSHAVDVAKRLPVDFLADISALLDPRHAAAINGALPEATIVAVGKELAAREDWITLGELVASISDTSARATEAALDGTALVRSAFLVDDAAQLERFVDLASQDKLVEMLWATAECDLWAEFRATLDVLSESAIDVIRAAAEKLPVEQRDRALTEIADRRSTW